ACGGWSVSTDHVVALSPQRYWSGGGTKCWSLIRVYYQGRYVDARVVDLCETCQGDSIDLAISAFEVLAHGYIGELLVGWEYR
ncbi:hypothetical protein CPB83DRAFT_765588, partial [Crepidotus variabilis]